LLRASFFFGRHFEIRRGGGIPFPVKSPVLSFPLARSLRTGTIAPVKSAPLGFFDSGVGGLTVVRAVQELLPGENIVYLGDTARLPYGSKSPETIRHFADEDTRFLISRGVKAIVVACNTATAHALPSLLDQYRVPVIGVIEPGVDAALANEDTSRIGIIATRGTIRSHAYQHALALRRTGLIIHGQATPLLVPLIEENWIEHPATGIVLKAYLEPLVDKGIDTLMLACTHYPLLIPVLREILPPDIRLVDSATTCAEHLRRELDRLDLLAPEDRDGTLEIHLTDLSEEFEALARRFLKKAPGRIHRAVLGG
jgi:glutamate racemase